MEEGRKTISVKTAAGALFDMVLPRVCLVCGTELLRSEDCLCLECLSDLPYTFFWTLPRNPMADRFNERLGEAASFYEYAVGLCYYDDASPYSQVPRSVKYHRRFDCAKYFGGMLGSRLKYSPVFSDVDMVIPVPLHWTRRWRRGYNQAELIAKALAEEMSVPIRTDILKRTHRTLTQTRMKVSEKTSNVSGAFAATGMIEARHLLLVDDVFTSGATSAECYKALKPHCRHDTRISVATLSFVG